MSQKEEKPKKSYRLMWANDVDAVYSIRENYTFEEARELQLEGNKNPLSSPEEHHFIQQWVDGKWQTVKLW